MWSCSILLQDNIFVRVQFRACRGVDQSARRERCAPVAHAVLKQSRPDGRVDGAGIARSSPAFALANTRQLCNYKERAQVLFRQRRRVRRLAAQVSRAIIDPGASAKSKSKTKSKSATDR
jgi:hypothetical protein